MMTQPAGSDRFDDASCPRAMESLSWLLAIVAALTALRIGASMFSLAELFFDEAQYWSWAQDPAWSYFSKPPFLAWTIGAAQFVCGTDEWCVRLPSPLFHGLTSILVYFIGLKLIGRRVAFWSALTYCLAPGVIFSTRLISTDVPLLLFWALGLLAFIELRERPRLIWALILGLALGLGLLSKYAMAYFILCAGLAAFIDPPSRALWRHWSWWLALGIGLVILLPNILWNFTHDLVTFRHLGHNARGGGFHLNPLGVLEFLAAQFGVIGLAFGAVIAALAIPRRWLRDSAHRLLMAFALPPLIIISIVALTSRANANWAAAAAIASVVLFASLVLHQRQTYWLRAMVIVGLLTQAALIAGDSFADRISLPGRKKADIYAPVLGWRALGEKMSALAQEQGARALVSDVRSVESELIYYARGSGVPVFAWPQSPTPRNEFEMSRPFKADVPGPALFVSICNQESRLRAQMAEVTPLGMIETPTGKTSSRRFFVYRIAQPLPAFGYLKGC